MIDPFGNMRKYLIWTFILIVFLLMSGIAVGKDYHKIIPLNPEDTGGQYCFVKVIIKQQGDKLLKKKFWSVLMVKRGLIHQVIGSYLLNFIIEM